MAQVRPEKKFAHTFRANRESILALAQTEPRAGGEFKWEPPFIGIPIRFRDGTSRTAWIEISKNKAMLDLKSLLGIGGTDSWTEISKAEAGDRLALQGVMQWVRGVNDEVSFISPSGEQRITLRGTDLPKENTGEAATVVIERTPDDDLQPAGWKLVEVKKWDWLEEGQGSVATK